MWFSPMASSAMFFASYSLLHSAAMVLARARTRSSLSDDTIERRSTPVGQAERPTRRSARKGKQVRNISEEEEKKKRISFVTYPHVHRVHGMYVAEGYELLRGRLLCRSGLRRARALLENKE